jgi:hypothetical protein
MVLSPSWKELETGGGFLLCGGDRALQGGAWLGGEKVI